MLGKKLINSGPISSGANTFASENFNTVLYTGNGGTQRIGGYINRGAVFNGSSSKITISGNPFNLTTYSLSFWINSANYNQSTTTVVNIGLDNSGGNWGGLAFGVNANKIFYYGGDVSGVGGSGFFTQTGTTNITNGSWVHVAIIVNGTSVTGYVNGSQDSGLSRTLGANIVYKSASSNHIGVRSGAFGSYGWWNGTVDQVRVFDKAISSSEVTTLYGETFASTTISTTDIFEDNSGIALYQLDGNANDTGINVAAHTGKSLVLSGNNAAGQPYAYSANITNGTSYTIAAWVKFDSVSSNAFIFSKFENNVNENFLFQTSSGSLYGVIYTSGSAGVGAFSNSALDVDRWYHIAFVIGGGTVKLYMDGAYVSQLTYSGNPRTSNRYIQFGWRSGGSTGINSPMDGLMEDVQFYNSALSAGDITTIYSNGTASGLVARWKFDDNLNDETGNYNATSTNTVSYSTDVPGARTIRKNGTASNITYQEATRFQPDLVWIKARSVGYSHSLQDIVRGTGTSTVLNTDLNVAQGTYGAYGQITSFDTNGFTVASGGHSQYGTAQVNDNGVTYVAWCFKGGGSVSANNNSDGSETTTVSANQAAGFSIVKLNKTDTNLRTYGHGLSSVPEMIILKRTASSDDWYVYHKDLGNSVRVSLNSSAAKVTGTGVWGSTTPTSSVFTLQNQLGGDHIAYCFHSVNGYQKIGSYTGTGNSEGNIVETGFEPAFLMIKSSSNAEPWFLLDNKRDIVNPRDNRLMADSSAAESAGSVHSVDFLSNGFKLNGTVGNGTNGNGVAYIYLAIAADPDQTDPTVENSFSPVLWSGTGSARSVTELGFKPDLIWWKARNASNYNWKAVDSINGPTKNLYNNLTNSLATDVATTSFDDDGFTFGSGGNGNVSGLNYVGYAWKAGDHDDSIPQINTEGTIDSIVSVNDAAGFSIVKYTGNNGASGTIGHGLSSAPELIITKALNYGAGWPTQFNAGGTAYYGLRLNTNGANDAANGGVFYNNTAPTSTVFTVGGSDETNDNYNYISYCWYSVTGHSKIGSYTGNNTSQTINVGFQPRFVMIKGNLASTNWVMIDSLRDNGDEWLYANTSDSTYDDSNTYTSFASNGFSVNTNATYVNANGYTYIYMAFK